MPMPLTHNKFVVIISLSLLVLLALALSGFTITALTPNDAIAPAAPNLGEESLVDVIKNGGFEEWDEEDTDPPGVSRYWEGYTNGKAIFGFYDEQWIEAIRTGEHSQLMEINIVDGNILERFMAVHQTVDVNPNSQYNLTLYAVMRSQALEADRNNNEFEMHWGVDYTGSGDYDNVETWNFMPLTEQYRLGSSGEYPEDVPLVFEIVTGTIDTTGSDKVTLFIRGLKKFPTGTEINFNIDDVSLIGPPPGAPAATPTPTIDATPEMPTSGAISSGNTSVGAVLLGGLVLLVLGSTAAVNLLKINTKS